MLLVTEAQAILTIVHVLEMSFLQNNNCLNMSATCSQFDRGQDFLVKIKCTGNIFNIVRILDISS